MPRALKEHVFQHGCYLGWGDNLWFVSVELKAFCSVQKIVQIYRLQENPLLYLWPRALWSVCESTQTTNACKVWKQNMKLRDELVLINHSEKQRCDVIKPSARKPDAPEDIKP